MKQTYLTTIGLEIHAHLLTKTKMFCACPNNFGNQPNTNVCPICLGMPGTLPVPNIEAIKKALLAGLALNCNIPSFTKWDRKHYFYPDLPKGYQISQYDLPLCGKGFLEITLDSGENKKIGITRAHLEEDAGKLIHAPNSEYSLVDLNRAGTPLLEIVSEPDLNSPSEAVIYAKQIKNILSWIGVNSGNLQEGALRFDVNISIRPEGQKELGIKVEIKNLNSFRALEKSLEIEIARQTELLENGGKIIQETRLWDPDKETTRSMRSKEEAQDYRYFPEPDIPPFTPSSEFIEDLRKQLPLLPKEIQKDLKNIYQLSDLDSHVITSDKTIYDLFKKTLDSSQNNPILNKQSSKEQAKSIANWLSGKFLNLLREKSIEPNESKINSSILIELLELLAQNNISSTTAKEIFEQSFSSGESPKNLVNKKGLNQINNTEELELIINAVISNNSSVVESIQNGKTGAIGFLVGQVMKQTQGKANPQMVNEIIKKMLKI